MHYYSGGFQCLCHPHRFTVGEKSHFKVFSLLPSRGLFYLYDVGACECVFLHVDGSCWWRDVRLFGTCSCNLQKDAHKKEDPQNQAQKPSHHQGPWRCQRLQPKCSRHCFQPCKNRSVLERPGFLWREHSGTKEYLRSYCGWEWGEERGPQLMNSPWSLLHLEAAHTSLNHT